MDRFSRLARLAVIPLGVILLAAPRATHAEDQARNPCTEDAMIVFDASGSMAGNVDSGIATTIPRIDEVRKALGQVLPMATHNRRVGLITYGPGPYQQCNVELNLRPVPNAAKRIMHDVNELNPAGKTPLTKAVQQAAEVLDYREKPGVVVLLTDGEETCGGTPCKTGQKLHADAFDLTVHVISFRFKNIYWAGQQTVLDTKCLAEENGGLYLSVDSEQDLVKAFEKTLGCPMMSEWSGASRNQPRPN
jgi:Ca-activated chloride channel family protein